MRILISSTTNANVERAKLLSAQRSVLVVGCARMVRPYGIDMQHAVAPAQALKLLSGHSTTISDVITFSDQISAGPVAQIYIRSGGAAVSLSSFELICAVKHSAAVHFENGTSYAVSPSGGGTSAILVALANFLAREEAREGSIARALAGSRLRKNHLLRQVFAARELLSSVMNELYAGRLDFDTAYSISEQLRGVEKCARRELRGCVST